MVELSPDETGVGIGGLDELIGGVRKGSLILVCGETGTGKSYFGYQYLYMGHALYQEPGVLISFDERPEVIRHNAARRNIDFASLERENVLRIGMLEPLEVQRFARQESIVISDMLYTVGAKRVFIDCIDSYELLFPTEYDRKIMLMKLLQEISRRGCTIMVASQLGVNSFSRHGLIDILCDAIFKLGKHYTTDAQGQRVVRTFEIIKMRDRKHPLGPLRMEFTSEGIEVSEGPL